ncbi:MAG: RICIN domain-containing protein [Faecalicatena sp.]|uniref:RICIN domain-containing protein n=1 Tax=Faecalicatena sp. TaxID=2005360 RepID=UPI002587D98D|nr:RICIN domain-containing protein [Faecalicatena sp.]MCI6464709.1 RICIN domain-containing protein [Faecalicatena sp.]MDY5618287.1 RICIN domain-containing protein [Lachnospiraceae bacterium]
MKGWTKVVSSLVLATGIAFSIGNISEAKVIENGTDVFKVSVNDSFDAEQALTYGRVLCLKNSGENNGVLLATCDQHMWVNSEQVWPIYRSTDDGETWQHISDVTDEVFGTNRKAQPMIYELPQAVGDMPAGTLLLAGNLVPDDQSSSRIVIYKSTDVGANWEYVSTVDVGGPFDYDRSPESTTSTIWEPFLYMDDYGHLICAFSDERLKGQDVLQSLSLRYTSDGINWSEESNLAAIKNKNDRPGMVTVSKMPNGKYIATYEVVNRPSYDQNSSVVYCKFSDDGLTWDEDDLGTLVQTADGQCLGSSPYVKWVDAGGPNGMVIIGAKWVVNASGDIQEGGQNIFVNYNFGEGCWERYPQALTWDGEDIIYLDAFSQCIETNVDNTKLYQIANIGNPNEKASSLRIGTLPLTMDIYEAENAVLNNVQVIECEDSSNKSEVGYINYNDSQLTFDKVMVPQEGAYTVYVRYNNGSGSESRHQVTVNGQGGNSVVYAQTPNWHQYYWAEFTCDLNAGTNTISLAYDTGYAEVDCIAVYKSDLNLGNYFMLKNRNSEKYLEVPSMSVQEGQTLAQYDKTYYPCQVWQISDTGNGVYFANKNSGLALDINESSSQDGASAVQNALTQSNSQLWNLEMTEGGYYHLVNINSQKYLEVVDNLTTNGAAIGQWGPTGYTCQEWTFVKEGIQ